MIEEILLITFIGLSIITLGCCIYVLITLNDKDDRLR